MNTRHLVHENLAQFVLHIPALVQLVAHSYLIAMWKQNIGHTHACVRSYWLFSSVASRNRAWSSRTATELLNLTLLEKLRIRTFNRHSAACEIEPELEMLTNDGLVR